MADSNSGKIKGAAFRQFVLWWEENRGREQMLAAFDRMRITEHRNLLDPEREALGILASRWYPADLIHALLDELTAGISRGQRLEMAEIAADAVMTATFSGVYKAVFVALASPPRMVAHIQRIWDMHYDSGKVTITPMSPREHSTCYSQWDSHHEFICQLNMASARPIYKAMRCQNVQIERVQCVSDGAPDCRFRVHWE